MVFNCFYDINRKFTLCLKMASGCDFVPVTAVAAVPKDSNKTDASTVMLVLIEALMPYPSQGSSLAGSLFSCDTISFLFCYRLCGRQGHHPLLSSRATVEVPDTYVLALGSQSSSSKCNNSRR